jgi:hypothetical protein
MHIRSFFMADTNLMVILYFQHYAWRLRCWSILSRTLARRYRQTVQLRRSRRLDARRRRASCHWIHRTGRWISVHRLMSPLFLPRSHRGSACVKLECVAHLADLIIAARLTPSGCYFGEEDGCNRSRCCCSIAANSFTSANVQLAIT